MVEGHARPADLKAACVTQARAIIAQRGVDALSLREVARRLGVSHQAPYRHFPTRDDLLAEVVADAFETLADVLEARERPPAGSDALVELAALGRAYLGHAAARPLEYQLMFATPLPDADRHPRLMAAARRAFAVLTGCVAPLGDSADGDRVTLDGLFIWSMIHGLASMFQSGALQTIPMPPGLLGQLAGHVDGRMRGAFGVTVPE